MALGGVGYIKVREERKRLKEESRQRKIMEARDRKCPPATRAMIQTFMKNLPREMTIEEVKVLGKLFTKHPDALRLAMEAARNAFLANAEIYIEKHRDSVRAAYAAGDYDTAARHAEWAIERLGTKQGMLLEQPSAQTNSGNGPRILIGVNMGGIKPTVDVEGSSE